MAIHIINLGTAISFVKFSTMLFGRPPVNEETATHAAATHAAGDTQVGAPEAGPESGRHSKQPDAFTSGIALIMGLACFAGGAFAAPIVSTIFPVYLSVSGAYVAEKLITFAITIGVAAAIYFLVIKRTHVLDVLRSFKVRLTDLSLGVLGFFAITAGYLVITL